VDATFIISDAVDTLVPRTAPASHGRPHRYRISFADGSVGTRFYDEPLKVGQLIVDRGALHLISAIDRQSEYGGIGRASAIKAPPAGDLRAAA
jgi:hypothetical protein